MSKKIKFLPGNKVGMTENPDKAGIIEVRPGTKGIDLGEKKYAAAYLRVLDEEHYVQGMCLYSNDLPESYDVVCYALPYKVPALFKTVTPELNLSTDVMTRVKNDLYVEKGVSIENVSQNFDRWCPWCGRPLCGREDLLRGGKRCCQGGTADRKADDRGSRYEGAYRTDQNGSGR